MFQEFQRIREDCRRAVSHGDLCVTQDFVTDTNRKESFGVIVVDFVAEKYEMEDGRFLHMSKQTASNAKHEMLTVSLSCMFYISVHNLIIVLLILVGFANPRNSRVSIEL